jgi:iron(III) transport system permease protein
MTDTDVAPGWRVRLARATRTQGVGGVERAIFAGLVIVLLILVLYPLVMIFVRSFETEDAARFTLENYFEVFGTPQLHRTFANTIFISAWTAAIAVALGVSLAWINARTNTPGSRVLANLNLIPFFTPPFVGAIAWTVLGSKTNGMLNQWASALFGLSEPVFNVYSPFGIVWVLALYETPLAFLFVAGAFRKMDPSLEEASRMAGAGILGTTLRITLPLMLPSILAAALLIFVTVLGSLEVPLILGIPARFAVLTTELFSLTNEYPARYNGAATLCTIVLVVTALCLFLQRRVLLRRSYVTVTGKAYRPTRTNIGRWKWAALAWTLLYLLVAVVLPFFAILVQSFDSVWTGSIRWSQFSLENYRYIFFGYEAGRQAFVNTMILAFSGATLCTGLAVITAYLVFRSRLPGRGTLDLLSGLPLAVPGAIFAVGVAICWIQSPLYGSLWIILIAYVAKFTPYAQRSVSATLLSVSPELDECSRTSGASWWHTMRNVVLPLLKPGIVGGWLLIFIIIIRELGMSLFLYRTGTETIGIAIYQLNLESATGTAAACVVLTGMILAAVTLLRLAMRDDELTL